MLYPIISYNSIDILTAMRGITVPIGSAPARLWVISGWKVPVSQYRNSYAWNIKQSIYIWHVYQARSRGGGGAGGGGGGGSSRTKKKRRPKKKKKKERERRKEEDLGRKRIKSRERYNESSSFSNNLMKRQSLGANWIQIRIKSRERYNELSSFSINSMKCQSLGTYWIQTMIKSGEWYNESSSFFNNLMKRQSFRARRGGRGIWFKQGLRVENCTTNRLLSLVI